MAPSPFGEFDPRASPVLGGALFVLALVAAGALEHVQFSLRAKESTHWWASNGRDVVNAAAIVALTAALHLFGFSLPCAVGLSGAVLAIENTLQQPLHRHRAAGLASVGISLLLGAPLLFLGETAQRAFSATLLFLFPGAL